jgi:hypothetical protein
VERGRAADSHADGAIVPFPPQFKTGRILDLLPHSERKKLDKLYATGCITTVYRYLSEHPGHGKEIRPLRYLGNGKFWFTSIEGQRPLYGLDQLALRPAAPILIVEGEKTADAAQLRFPDYLVMTWMSGASNVLNTEVLLLAGRKITIWADNDPDGRKAARTLAAHALRAGAESVAIVDVPAALGEKWDLADAVPEEFAAEIVLSELLVNAKPVTLADVEVFLTDGEAKARKGRLLGFEPGYSRVDQASAKAALPFLNPDMSKQPWQLIGRCLFYMARQGRLCSRNGRSRVTSTRRAKSPICGGESARKNISRRRA